MTLKLLTEFSCGGYQNIDALPLQYYIACNNLWIITKNTKGQKW